jgi:hypothetical protein
LAAALHGKFSLQQLLVGLRAHRTTLADQDGLGFSVLLLLFSKWSAHRTTVADLKIGGKLSLILGSGFAWEGRLFVTAGSTELNRLLTHRAQGNHGGLLNCMCSAGERSSGKDAALSQIISRIGTGGGPLVIVPDQFACCHATAIS